MCRPNSASNGDGAKSATSTRCSSWPGAISSHAAGRPMLLGREIGRQPSAPAKKVSALWTSRVARVRWASDMAPPRRTVLPGSLRCKNVVDRWTGDIRQQVAVHPKRVIEHRDGELAVESQGAEEVHGLLFV